MNVQRAAAGLGRGDHDFATILLKHPYCRLIQPRERNIRDATRHHRHPIFPFALRWERLPDLAEKKWNLYRGRQGFPVAKRSQQFHQPGDAQHFLQSADLIHIKHRSRGGQQHRRGQQFPEYEVSYRPGEPRAPGICLDIGPGRFHQAPVLHTGRASALAAPACQAQVDMFPVRIADRLPFGNLHHLIDPAARRVHFNAELTVGGTRIQTESAMHAAVEIDLLRLVSRSNIALIVRGDRKDAHD